MTTNKNSLSVFHPESMSIFLGSYRIRNIARGDSAIQFRTVDTPSGLVTGIDSAAIVYASKVRVELDLEVILNSYDNTVLTEIEKARRDPNSTDRSKYISNVVGSDTPFVPLAIKYTDSEDFLITTLAWTMTNVADFSLPNSPSENVTRRWSFQFVDEIQDTYGAIGKQLRTP